MVRRDNDRNPGRMRTESTARVMGNASTKPRPVDDDPLRAGRKPVTGRLDELCDALLSGDAELLEEQPQAFVTNVLSYPDPGTVKPERVYHGFVVGLLAVLEPGYQVRSNRESGRGDPM
jgi:hypothetical protein